MEQLSLPKIELPQLMGYEWPCTQSYLLGRFVCKPELSTKSFCGDAYNRINTGDCPLRSLADLPPKHHAAVAFLQVRTLGLLSPIRFAGPTAAKNNRWDQPLTARHVWVGRGPSDLQMKPSSPYSILRARIEENRHFAHY